VIRKRSDRKPGQSLGSSSRDRKAGKYALLQGRRDRGSVLRSFRDKLKKWADGLSPTRKEVGAASRRISASVEPVRADSESRGTATLVLAVVGLIVSAVVMGALTMRLADQPAPGMKSVRHGPSASNAGAGPDDPWSRPGESAGRTPGEPPAPVTFYNDLTSQDEPVPPDCESPTPSPGSTPEPAPEQSKTRGKPAGEPNLKQASSPQRREGQVTRKATSKPTCPPAESSAARSAPPVPLPASGKKFTVQVGTFAHPSVAREWAGKWKERGYDVILKPVARPGSGVIYRLYLGSFEGEKEADELIRQLKAKEGVNAFRVSLI
jgi:cell division septation protein DedD